MQATQQQPGPPPEMLQMQAEQQAEQMRMQAQTQTEQMKMQAQAQIEQGKAQLEMQMHQAKVEAEMQLAQMKADFEAIKQNNELQIKARERWQGKKNMNDGKQNLMQRLKSWWLKLAQKLGLTKQQ
jgi:F0F1-type ATP synthase membrane subunit b/b'